LEVLLVVLGEEGSSVGCRRERVGGERREVDAALEAMKAARAARS